MVESAERYCELAIKLGTVGRHHEAADHARKATQLRPDFAAAWHILGVALEHLDSHAEAVAAYDRAVAIDPSNAVLHTSRGNALWKLGRPADAETAHRRAISLNPTIAQSYDNLARVLADQGRIDEILDCYRMGRSHCQGSAAMESNLLLIKHYDPRFPAEQLYLAAREWAGRHAEPLTRAAAPHSNDRNADRRLRIGYVSSDLRENPVGWLLEPIVAARDRSAFEIFCYAYMSPTDGQTEKLKALADVWRPMTGISDDAAAGQIRRDGIDILVDLSGHFGDNHLLLFARKPAPIQVSFLNYPDTTGMSAIDYRLTDSLCDPPGVTDRWHTEQLWWLDGGPWHYAPPIGCPAVSPLPARTSGGITFCNLNNPLKTSGAAIETWAGILRAVPNSHLMLQSRKACHSYIEQQFHKSGIGADRLKWVTPRLRTDYIALYGEADIALDPFPFNGGITTCDALWMGLPVVTLAGDTCTGRRGLAFMDRVALSQFVAASMSQYIEIVRTLAADFSELGALRSNLRQTMSDSPLGDATMFSRNVESCYREIWRKWCSSIIAP